MDLNPNSKMYRFTTMWHAFKALYHLSPQEVNAFLKSYEIYDCVWVNGQAYKDNKLIEYAVIEQGIKDWYGVLNHLCAIGQVEKMYIPPTLDISKNVIDNQIIFENRFAQLLRMKAQDKVFELGCGKGRVAAHLISTTGADITGINIDPIQLEDAKEFINKIGKASQCRFINADFNELPFSFADNQFDSIYEIQALSLCRDLPKLFQELNRILKPGGRFSLLEWVRLPKYHEDNPHHQDLMKHIKPLIGAIGTPSPAEYEKMLSEAGFRIILSEDPSINQSQYPLIKQAGSSYNKLRPLIKFFVFIKLLPSYFITLFDRLSQDVDALCEADKLGLITMSYHMIAEKIDKI